MKRFLFVLCVASATLALAATPDPFEIYLANVDVLQSKAVQKELGVTEAQRARLNELASEFNLLAKQIQEEAPSDQMVERLLFAKTKFKAELLHELTDPQVKRLAQISLQKAGPPVVFDPEFGKKIGLTEAQRKSLASAWDHTGRQVAAAFERVRKPVTEKYRAMKPASDAEKQRLQKEFADEIAKADATAMPDVKKYKEAFEKTLRDTLTDGQRKTWADLKGKEFVETN